MASAAQIAANRRNAERSTGPRTAEGKARVAQNGLKHGLCAAETVLPWEDRAEFEALLAELAQQFQPADEIELALLLQFADAMWRRQRCPTLETGLLAGAMPETTEGCPEGVHPTVWAMGQAWMARGNEINRLSLHESRLARLAERALDRLLATQARRRRMEAENPLPPLRERVDGAQRRPGEGQGSTWSLTPSPALRPDPHPNPLPQEREREQDQILAPELALDLQQNPLPPLRERVDGAERRPGEGQRTAWSGSSSPARRPDPHPGPLPQGREREQDQALAQEMALLSRKAA